MLFANQGLANIVLLVYELIQNNVEAFLLVDAGKQL